MNGRIVIAGGTGVLGTLLCRSPITRDYEIVVLGRAGGPGIVHPDHAHLRFHPWDGRTVGPWARELDAARAVINLAGRSVNCRYTARHRREIMDSRVLSTHALGEAIGRCNTPPAVWINSSTATIYRHTFGPPWAETGEIGATDEAQDAFSIHVATAWERAFFTWATPTVRMVALRTAIVLSRRAGTIVPILRRLVRLRLGGRMGSGRQWVSWIHQADFCRAVAFILTHSELEGAVNVASPQPVSNADLMRTFREVYGVRWGLPATRWMLEVGSFFLRTEAELIIKSRAVAPAKLLQAGFAFDFPDLRSALSDLLCQRR